MNEIEREKNRIKVAKYRARKKAREQGLDPDKLPSAPTESELGHSNGTATLAALSEAEAEKLRDEWYGRGYDAGYDDGREDGEHDAYAEGEREGYDAGFNEGYEEALEHSSADVPTKQSIPWGMIALLLAVVLVVAGPLYGASRKSIPSLATSPTMQQAEVRP
jgi:flagellar biosynthesis/type III secretory pathway protein FliH